jgi:hypothetical protein
VRAACEQTGAFSFPLDVSHACPEPVLVVDQF